MKSCFNVFISLAIATLMLGCATIRPVPVQTTTNVQTVVKDSIRWKDSTVYVQVPVERYVDVVRQYDTLKLESTLARSVSYVDTLTHTLKGKLEQTGDVKTIIKYKDRKVVEYRDSVSIKEVPVEVEVIRKVVPKWCWWLLVFDVLVCLTIVVLIYLKHR